MEDFGLLYFNARFYDPSLGRFASADNVVPGGIQGFDRYAYANNSPMRYTDPSGHFSCEGLSDYRCRIRATKMAHSNYQGAAQGPYKGFTLGGQDWTMEELIAINMAWALLIEQFGSEAALIKAMGGNITFLHVPTDVLKTEDGKPAVAMSMEGIYTRFIHLEHLNTILVDQALFPATGTKMTWYALHEIGHIFDYSGAHGDPAKYKSNWFVTAFNSGCGLSEYGCERPQWNPTDQGTTEYGLKDSVEDFAESFASTVLHNTNMTYALPPDVSQARMNIINVLIASYQ